MKKQIKLKIIIPVTAIILVAAIAVVSVFTGNVKPENKNFANGKQEVAFGEDFNMEIGDSSKSLLFNKEKGAVAFKYGEKALFNSSSEKAAQSGLANIISVRLRDKKGNIYSLDSTGNAVMFSSVNALKEGNTIKAELTLFPNKDEYEKGAENADIFALLPLEFTYENSKFSVSLNTENVSLPKGMYLETVSLLPGLFSAEAGQQGSSYIVPDGSGAKLDLYKPAGEDLSAKLNVYGNDTAFYDYSQGALLPYFAYIKNGVLINCLIEEGDGLSEISVKRNSMGGGYLYNTFTVTPVTAENGKLLKGETYRGILKQSYILTLGENDYNEVAAQTRDSLIEKGYINEKLNGIYNDFPFFIQVLGSTDGKQTLTTFEDAAEITAFLKSRGVRNISLRLTGFSKKGMGGDFESNTAFSNTLGGKQGYENLANTLKEQGNRLFLDANVSAKTGKKGVSIYDTESKFAGVLAGEFTLSSVEKVNENISDVYNFATNLSNTDICLNDASKHLYSDIKGKLSRQSVLESFRDKASSLSAAGSVMLAAPSVYLMREADSVFSVPDTSSLSVSANVQSVPVLQMVLHGSVVYGSNPLNITNLSNEDALLKCIEYGAVPTFMFTYTGENSLNYSGYSSLAASYYSKAKSLFPVMDMKITSHEEIADNVYKITYDYTKIIYVNYNPSAVKVDGIMVSAKDFVVI